MMMGESKAEKKIVQHSMEFQIVNNFCARSG